MIPSLLLSLALATAPAAEAAEPLPLETRARFARDLITDAGLPAGSLDDDQAIATAVLLLQSDKASRRLRRKAKKAGVSGESLLFKIEMRRGRITRVVLEADTPVPDPLVVHIAKTLTKAKATYDVDANVFFPVVL